MLDITSFTLHLTGEFDQYQEILSIKVKDSITRQHQSYTVYGVMLTIVLHPITILLP